MSSQGISKFLVSPYNHRTFVSTEMTPERWRQIEALYYAARERDGDDCVRFLNESCGDTELRREVESLLSHHLDWLSRPALAADPLRAGIDFIGHYRVTAKL